MNDLRRLKLVRESNNAVDFRKNKKAIKEKEKDIHSCLLQTITPNYRLEALISSDIMPHKLELGRLRRQRLVCKTENIVDIRKVKEKRKRFKKEHTTSMYTKKTDA